MSLTVQPGRGVGRILDTDVAFAGDACSWVGDALPLVTAASDIEPFQLMELLRAAFFSASDDADADSWERQRDVFEQEALHIATRLLVSDDAARRSSIAEAVARELFWLIPHDRGAEISVRDRKVMVTLGAPAAQPPPERRARRQPAGIASDRRGRTPCSRVRTGADTSARASGSVLRTTACGSVRTAARSRAAAAPLRRVPRRRFPKPRCCRFGRPDRRGGLGSHTRRI